MSKRWSICAAVLLWACAAGFAKDRPSFFADDFLNQTVFVATDGSDAKQCQAIRIMPKWYLTAAHCVRPYCDRECRLTFSLIQGKVQASAHVYHTSSRPSVFVQPKYRAGTAQNIRYDMALVHFDPAPEDYFFYDTSSKEVLDEKTFLSSINREQKLQWQTLQHSRPKLLSVTNTFTRKVEQPLAVPDLRQEGIYFKESRDLPFYYFTELRHYLGLNFGIEKGMSGSGVILPGGAVIGVVSASLSKGATLGVYDEQDRLVGTVPYSADYFMFTPISQENANFIKATVSSLHEPGYKPNMVVLDSRYAEPTEDTLQSAFGGALTVREIMNSNEK